MKRKRFKGVAALLFLIQVGIFIGIFLFITSLITKCNKELEDSGKTLVEVVGEQSKIVTDEFNKGFNKNTKVVASDSIMIVKEKK